MVNDRISGGDGFMPAGTGATAASQEKANYFIPPSIQPDPRTGNLAGLLRALISNPVSAIPEAAYYEPVTIISIARERAAFVCDTDLLEQILIKRVADFPKSLVDERILRPALGEGLLTAQGEDWRWKRRLTAPHFSPTSLAKYLEGMVVPFEELAQSWARDGEDADISAGMTLTTLEVINRTVFGKHHSVDLNAFSQALIDYLIPISWTSSIAMLKLPAWLPHPGRRRLMRGRDEMRRLMGEVVDARRGQMAQDPDICSVLMAAQDPETGQVLSDDDMVDMLVTLIAAGHETSANALTWACFCLAEQRELQEELREEVDTVIGNRPMQAGHLPQLEKVEAFICESMRLFPPVPLLARSNIRPELIGEETMAPNATLFIPVYAIHRHRSIWDDPDRFDVTRFLGPESRRIPRTAYLPFGAGPRICVGGSFAMMEMVAGLATLLRKLRIESRADTECEPIHRITLRPKNGLSLSVRPV